MNAADRKLLLAELVAAVIRGLPVPTGISIYDNGEAYLTLEYCADVAAWTDPATVYEYLYEPEEQHPTGHRINGGYREMFGTTVHVTANEELPAPGGHPGSAAEQTVLGFVEGSTVDGGLSEERLAEIEQETADEHGPVCDAGDECDDCVVQSVPEHARESLTECVNCGELIWKGLVWVHLDGEDAQCSASKEMYAKPVDERLPLDEAWEAAHEDEANLVTARLDAFSAPDGES